MNERIRELAEQANWLFADKVTGEFTDYDKRIQKFAELIVRECIGITDDLVNRNVDGSWTSNELYTDYNGALFEVKRRIEEHFGVEELQQTIDFETQDPETAKGTKVEHFGVEE